MGGASVVNVVVVVVVVVSAVVVVVNADSRTEDGRLVEMTPFKAVEMTQEEMIEAEKRRPVESAVEEEEKVEIREVEMRKMRTNMKKEIARRRRVEEINRWRLMEEEEEEMMTEEEEEEEEEVNRRKKRDTDTEEQMEVRRRLVEMTQKKKEEEEEMRVDDAEEVEKEKENSEARKQKEIRRRLVEMTQKKEEEEEEMRVEDAEDVEKEKENSGARKQKEIKRRLVEMTQKKEEEEEEEGLPVLSLSPKEISLVSGDSYTFEVSLSKDPSECIEVFFNLTTPLGSVAPPMVTLCAATTPTAPPTATLTTTAHGTTIVTATAAPEGLVEYEEGGVAFSLVSVMRTEALTTTADVLGWLYTIAWDISFLPQILHNWRRKSVVGLSFDFLTFNFLGFFCYFLFNMGMLWIPEIQDQYTLRHPQTILHVRLNDVIFPLYALLCTAIQILQCFFYQRADGQRVSLPCRIVSVLLLLAAVIGCILVPLVDDWWWLDLLYLLSYVKLAITCIKYVPQLYVNYRHRSTEGWSIYQVILDFTGGSLSLVQMFLLSANYDDWHSLLTDPTKLGLGLLSILFNILFFIQHYFLYRNVPSSKRALKGEEGPMATLEASPSLPPTTLHSPPPPSITLGTAETGKRREEEEEEEEKGERSGGRREEKELREVVIGEKKKEEEEKEEENL